MFKMLIQAAKRALNRGEVE